MSSTEKVIVCNYDCVLHYYWIAMQWLGGSVSGLCWGGCGVLGVGMSVLVWMTPLKTSCRQVKIDDKKLTPVVKFTIHGRTAQSFNPPFWLMSIFIAIGFKIVEKRFVNPETNQLLHSVFVYHGSVYLHILTFYREGETFEKFDC